jgi:hypothetical protein
MPGLPAPATGERDSVLEFLRHNQDAFVAVAHGLTDEQARATPTVSALTIGGLIKHVTSVQLGWMARVAAAPAFPPKDPRSFEELMAARQSEYVMRDDETLEQVLAALRAQNAATLKQFAQADLDTPVPVPADVPWFPKDVPNWSVRWVALHLIAELTRHAGHADIIRESIDGATMYELIAAAEGWPAGGWLKPWKAPRSAE